jgi:hypothetical protein
MSIFQKLVDVDRGAPRKQAYRDGTTTVIVYPPKRKTAIGYTSRKNLGKATVVEGYRGETGDWVVLHDKQRDVRVTVRPSQVSL